MMIAHVPASVRSAGAAQRTRRLQRALPLRGEIRFGAVVNGL